MIVHSIRYIMKQAILVNKKNLVKYHWSRKHLENMLRKILRISVKLQNTNDDEHQRNIYNDHVGILRSKYNKIMKSQAFLLAILRIPILNLRMILLYRQM